MEPGIVSYLIVCPLVFLASFVDAIAGGGGLISLPAYLLAGVPIHNAIATNKLSSAAGTVISTARYCKNRYADVPLAVPSFLVALLGSFMGANLALITSDKVLKLMLIAVLPVVAFYVLKNKSMESKLKRQLTKRQKYAIVITASFVIGTYDGFYGPGTGTFLLLVYTGLAGMDIRTASGNTKIVNLASNLAALGAFFFSGKIVVTLGLAAAVFSIAGHYIGSGMVIKNGTRIVRPIVVTVLVLLFIKIVSGFFV
ncbi:MULTISPECIES: sulfite exporter TauE/SafE family protein [Blautia]|uniref:Probable membrane transporter protein n=1 Tax=Blautia hominis TaxID=2025493 RepID=A0ABQ0B899_9FIRM|nr:MULTISPECIES: TSUP family transporter [Blautia]